MAGTPSINAFDNENSVLYKWAALLRVPKDFTEVIERAPEEIEEVRAQVDPKLPAVLIDFLSRYEIRSTLDEVQNLLESEQDLTKISEEFPTKVSSDIAMIFYGLLRGKYTDESLLDNINKFYATVNLPPIDTTTTLTLIYSTWLKDFDSKLASDRQILQRIEINQNLLNSQRVLHHSSITVDKITVQAFPLVRPALTFVSPADGLDIFNQSRPSFTLPFLQYNGPMERYYKVYQGESTETLPDYSLVLQKPTNTLKHNFIYMTVWNGENLTVKPTKKTYREITYDLSANLLSFEREIVETDSGNRVLNNIREALPLQIDESDETSVSGLFYIYGIEVVQVSFLDMVLNDSLFYNYLFMKEYEKSAATKVRFPYLFFKSVVGDTASRSSDEEGSTFTPFSAKLSLKQWYSEAGQKADLSDGSTINLPTRTPYLSVRITSATSRAVIEQILEIFIRLLYYYSTKRTEIENDYARWIPGISFTPIIPPVKKGKTKAVKESLEVEEGEEEEGGGGVSGKRGSSAPVTVLEARRTNGRRINQLKAVAPDLFVKRYARACQSERQPMLLDNSEVAAYQAQTFVHDSVTYHRQVLRFPPDNPRWNIACPSDANPFPGFRPSNLGNKHIYPSYPCCYETNHLPDNEQVLVEQYLHGIPKKTTGPRPGQRINTDKILDPNRDAVLPYYILKLLQEGVGVKDFVRFGVPRSPNSLIHCLYLATNTKNYVESTSDEEKESFTNQIREYITQKMNLDLLKQELYEFSDDEIRTQLLNFNKFFDPALYYRALEVLFGVNIYVFVPPSKKGSSEGYLEIPRHKLFHSRVYRPDRRCVLIIKHRGSDADMLEYPQCELIVDFGGESGGGSREKNVIKMFDPNMSLYLHQALINTDRVISWSKETRETQGPADVLVARTNIFSRVNFMQILGNRATRQLLDNYGKLRGLFFPDGPYEISVFFPASQPENLPSLSLDSLPPAPPASVILTNFGRPSLRDTELTGLWFPILDLAAGIYCPIDPKTVTPELLSLPLGPVNPVTFKGDNSAIRLTKLRKTLDLYLQVLLWLFLLSGQTVDDFANNYMIVGTDTDVDSSTVYDLSSLPQHFPKFDESDLDRVMEEAILYLSRACPTLILDNRLKVYSEKFFTGIIYFLQEYEKTVKPEKRVLPERVERLFQNESDFQITNHVALFIHEKEFVDWLQTIREGTVGKVKTATENRNLIRKQLDISFASFKEPYIFTDSNEKIYLIQNVVFGDRLRALNVAKNWQDFSVNLGYSTGPLTETLPPYLIYAISTASQPLLVEDLSNNAENPLLLLNSAPAEYSAMLPLL